MRLDGVSASAVRNPTNNINQGASKQGNINETVKINSSGSENLEVKAQNSKYEEVQGPKEKKYTEEEIIDFIEKSNNEIVTYNRKFEFAIHEKTKKIMVKVLDTTTDEIIREIPAEKLLDIMAGLWEVAGIMVDKKI